jgi:hypothetical protein
MYYAISLIAFGWILVLYLLVGRHIVKAIVKSGIRYAITNKRIIEIRRRCPVVINELRRKDLLNRVVCNQIGKIGTIQFNHRRLSGNPIAVLWLEVPFIHCRARSLTLFDIGDLDGALKAIEDLSNPKSESCDSGPYRVS